MTKTFPRLRVLGLGLAFGLWSGTMSAEQFAIQIGNTISDGAPGAGAGRIDINTADDVYTFAGTNGQAIFLEELSVSNTFAGWLRWQLKAPGGAAVFSGYLEGNNEGRCVLPETGTYTLRVWVGAVNPAYTGTYSFRLRAIPADPTFALQVGDLIADGVPAAGAGNLEVPGAWDLYMFNAAAGQLVFFETISAAAAFQGNLCCELKAPSGNVVFSSYLTAGNHPGRKTLPEAGTYRVRVFVQGNGVTQVGPYSLRIRAIPPDQTFAIQAGDTVTNGVPAPGAGNVEVPGAQDYYTFTATAGQSVSFSALQAAAAFAGWLQWEARTPGGQTLFSGFFGDVGRKTLPETGTYTIRFWVGANITTYVGTYAFRVNTLPGDVRCAIQKGDVISDGDPVIGAGRIDQPGGLDIYTFDGLAGQQVNFEPISADAAFAGWLYWQVIAPAGTNWFAAFFSGGLNERRTLPETGTYTIRVFANTPNSAYVGAYSFRTWCEVLARPDQLATLPDTALAIPFNKFLCNDRLEIGDLPTVEVPVAASERGGSLATTANAVIYTPPAGFSGLDRFTYRLRGQFGDDDTAVVGVHVGAGVDRAATVVSLVREGTASVMVCLMGAPNQTYAVEQSDSLTAWSGIGLLTADEMGSMTYYYTIEPVEKRFYRFRRQ